MSCCNMNVAHIIKYDTYPFYPSLNFNIMLQSYATVYNFMAVLYYIQQWNVYGISEISRQ